eukprot:5750753-Amphidinium_carterae.1
MLSWSLGPPLSSLCGNVFHGREEFMLPNDTFTMRHLGPSPEEVKKMCEVQLPLTKKQVGIVRCSTLFLIVLGYLVGRGVIPTVSNSDAALRQVGDQKQPPTRDYEGKRVQPQMSATYLRLKRHPQT